MCESGRMKLDELYDILFRENVKCVKIRPCFDVGPVFSLLRCVTDDNVWMNGIDILICVGCAVALAVYVQQHKFNGYGSSWL